LEKLDRAGWGVSLTSPWAWATPLRGNQMKKKKKKCIVYIEKKKKKEKKILLYIK
jgi:hypothetical protein